MDMKEDKPIKVLIIDDEPVFRLGLSLRVKEHGMTPFTCQDGVEGVAMAKTLNPDIVTTDLMMPKIDGFETTRQILANNPETKVIVISGYGTDAHIIKAFGVGVSDFLYKPLTAKDLIAAIRSALTGAMNNQTFIHLRYPHLSPRLINQNRP